MQPNWNSQLIMLHSDLLSILKWVFLETPEPSPFSSVKQVDSAGPSCKRTNRPWSLSWKSQPPQWKSCARERWISGKFLNWHHQGRPFRGRNRPRLQRFPEKCWVWFFFGVVVSKEHTNMFQGWHLAFSNSQLLIWIIFLCAVKVTKPWNNPKKPVSIIGMSAHFCGLSRLLKYEHKLIFMAERLMAIFGCIFPCQDRPSCYSETPNWREEKVRFNITLSTCDWYHEGLPHKIHDANCRYRFQSHQVSPRIQALQVEL